MSLDLCFIIMISPIQFSSVAQSCATICDPVDCSMPGFPVHHQFPEPAQTHVHWVGDTMQPSHPLHPLLLLPSIFPSIRVFSSESVFVSGGQSTGASASASVVPMNIQDWFLQDWLVWSPCSPRDSQESSAPEFESINSMALSFPRRRQWHPTPVLLPGKSHGWRSLVGCSPWGR